MLEEVWALYFAQINIIAMLENDPGILGTNM